MALKTRRHTAAVLGGLTWITDALCDTRYTLRALARAPVFTAVTLLTVALGIGANTATFSFVRALLIKPLPYPDSDRLVWLVSHQPASLSPTGESSIRTGDITVAELLELRALATTVSHVGAYVPALRTLTGTNTTARLEGWRLEPVLLDMLGTQPFLGRAFTMDEAAPGADTVVLLSHGIWRAQFGGDRKILGRSIVLDGTPHRVVGVMPPEFQFPFELANRQFWVPLALATEGNAVNVRIPMMARLADGVKMQAAMAEVDAILREATGSGGRYELARVRDHLIEPVRPALVVLTAAAGCVLLIACANVAGLLLARNAARVREIAIRAALGAGRGRVVRQLLTEGVLLALLGAVGGVALAFCSIRLLRPLATTLSRMDVGVFFDFPRLDEVAIDGSVLVFALLIAVATGIVFGLVPAARFSNPTRMEAFREGGSSAFAGSGLRGRRNRTGGLLVVAETAAAMVLLVGGGLLMHSFLKLVTIDLGYEPSNVLTFQVALPQDGYPGEQLKTFAEDFVERLRSAPGVRSASYTTQLPMVSLLRNSAGFSRTPGPESADGTKEEDARFVSREYLEVMGIRVVAGRGFGPGDGPGQPRALIVNEALARRDFPGENAVGQTAYLRGQPQVWHIVGVVGDVRQIGLDEEPEPQVFIDARQWPGLPPGFRILQYYAVRTDGDPIAAVGGVRDVLRGVEPRAALYNIAPMEQLLSNSVSRPRLYAVLVGIFAAVAVALATIGVYGMVAYSVTRRTGEIGIRVALGASRFQVLGLVLRQSLALTATGVGLGLAAAAGVTRYLDAMLFGLAPLDPVTFAAAALLFTLVAVLAAYLPARRAARVDPMAALRYD